MSSKASASLYILAHLLPAPQQCGAIFVYLPYEKVPSHPFHRVIGIDNGADLPDELSMRQAKDQYSGMPSIGVG